MKNKTNKIIETLQKARRRFTLSGSEVILSGSSTSPCGAVRNTSGPRHLWVKCYLRKSYSIMNMSQSFCITLERDKSGCKVNVGTGTGVGTEFIISDIEDFYCKYLWLVMSGLLWIQDSDFACELSEADFLKLGRKYHAYGIKNVSIPSYSTYDSFKCHGTADHETLKGYIEEIWTKVSGLDVEESKDRVRDELPLLVSKLTKEKWITLYNEYVVQEILTS